MEDLSGKTAWVTGSAKGIGRALTIALAKRGCKVAVHYRIPGMPTTFFIDAEGIVRSMGAGLIVEEVLVEELARIGVIYEPEEP